VSALKVSFRQAPCGTSSLFSFSLRRHSMHLLGRHIAVGKLHIYFLMHIYFLVNLW